MFCPACGTQLPESAQFCKACGREIPHRECIPPDPMLAPESAASAAPRARRPRGHRFWVEAVGLALLAYLAYEGISYFRQPIIAYGPAAAEQLDLIVAPSVSVDILPAATSLAAARFESFDVSPNGTVLVSAGSRVFDMGTGKDVFTGGTAIGSFAFVGEALAVIDVNGKLGFFEDGRVHLVGDPRMPAARLTASSDRTRLLIFRAGYDDGKNSPALASMRAGSSLKVLAGSLSPVDAVGGDALQTFMATDHALFQVVTPGRPSLLFVLPDSTQSIAGIAVAGTAVYFATDQAVYALTEGMAAPLVIGLGGDLRLVGGALYVLDSRQGRVYRIVVSKAGMP